MILYLTNAPSEILALRSLVEALPEGFGEVSAADPSVLDAVPDLAGVDAVLVRLLGGVTAWPRFESFRRRARAAGVPLLAFGGEAALDAEMTAASSVASATVAATFEYLVHGGLTNLEQMLRFVSDTVLMTGFGFDPPEAVPTTGVFYESPGTDGPTVAVLFYRAHLIAGNTVFVEDLCRAIEQRGARAAALWAYSLRPDTDGRVAALELLSGMEPDAVITTVLVSGSAADDGLAWDASAIGSLGVPVLQAVTSTTSRAEWESSAAGLAPVDVAMRVAIPEFDGRIISVPFSFNEVVDDGATIGSPVTAYRTVDDRLARVAGTAVRLARLRSVPVAERRVAIVMSAYPTKRSRIGNAVALDTPASVVALLEQMRDAGYGVARVPGHGDDLMAELIDAFAYEEASLTDEQLRRAPGRWAADDYRSWWSSVPAEARQLVEGAWGEAPGVVYRDPDQGDLVFSGLDLGNVIITVQPPRGFGANPVAVYHSPDLPPTHHYLGFYRWLDAGWGADAIVHVGKHGTLEWLPGKGVGLSGACWPDLALGDVPLVYPFVVNDPGEGTQAKRRAHATIIDHLLPPMTRADTYDDVARLEQLLDEYAQVAALDPSKLPAIRAKVWALLVTAQLHTDMGVTDAPEGDDFDDLINHVDGYLCELKDAQIRGGLHTLGRVPTGEDRLDLLLALTRLPQAGVPSLRAVVAKRLGQPAGEEAGRADLDQLEAECRAVLEGRTRPGSPEEQAVIEWVDRVLSPALDRTVDEIGAVLAALDGRWVAPGPSGAPTRGMAHVLPTGRNFYSVDPKALPSQLAWDVGRQLADRLLARYQEEEGRYPTSVGLVVWGTAAMRTGGDDVAEALALLGVRPVWAAESGRVTGVERIPDDELDRPRVDVVLRISGFFRDAFPHLVALLDDAVRLAGFDDGDPRIFGAKPGAYGSGILPVLDSGNWRDDADLAEVYTAWSGYSYGRAGMGRPAADAMRRRFAAIEVAVKNQDNREHDIFDSDDYLQDHGGMIAAIRVLSGHDPKAYFGDSANPAAPRVRSLREEAARVVRTRVLNPKWISAMTRHGYKGAFELSATVDYLYGYDATAHVVEDWMYEKVTEAYVADPEVRKFLEASNPWALQTMAEKLLEAHARGLWDASDAALGTLRSAVLEAEGWEEGR
ncbi:MAG TPA: cobaltochelatase subunit CobN [Acidimicrobiales bacterium]|jgi:cobaltochelatase CobN|nr:cobaltochelatase subunit CobN [Acidimicrobiales bacterium]